MEKTDDIFECAPFFSVSTTNYGTQQCEVPLKRNSGECVSAEGSGVNLQWRNINVSQTNNKSRNLFPFRHKIASNNNSNTKILDNVSGLAQAGSFVAIVSPSAVSSTALLRALSLTLPSEMSVTGNVVVNGHMLTRQHLQQLTGFVDINNIFYSTITVSEHLSYTAKLKLDSRFKNEQTQQRINAIINQVGIRQRGNELIGNLSKSELKRLAIATESIGDPPLLFCNEPIFNLEDQQEAQNIVGILETMAAKGKTIICAIQSPSSNVFVMFTDLCLLGANGQVAFMGPIREASSFFESLGYICPPFTNLANFYLEKVTIDNAGHLTFICDKFHSSRYFTRLTNFTTSTKQQKELSLDCYIKYNAARYKTSWFSQFIILLRRSMMNSLRQRQTTIKRIAQKLIIGIIVAMMYINTDSTAPNNFMGIVFLLLIANTQPTLYAAIQSLSKEIPCINREMTDKLYRIETFYLVKVLVAIPECVIETMLSFSIVYWILGLNAEVICFLYTLLIIIMLTNISTAIGFLFSPLRIDVITTFVALVSLDYILLALGGLFINAKSINPIVRWAAYLSSFRYANEALHIIQWQNNINKTFNSTINFDEDVTLNSKQAYFQMQGFKEDNLGICFMGLGILYVALHMLSCFTLYLKVKYRHNK